MGGGIDGPPPMSFLRPVPLFQSFLDLGQFVHGLKRGHAEQVHLADFFQDRVWRRQGRVGGDRFQICPHEIRVVLGRSAFEPFEHVLRSRDDVSG